MHKLTIGSIELAYREIGKGQPVIFVHGFGSHSYTWTYIFQYASPHNRLIALDLKGFGLSDKPLDHHYSPYDQAKLLIDFVHSLHLDNTILVGHSLGGFICLIALLLNMFNCTISGLVLIDSVGYFQHIPAFIKSLQIPLLNKIALDTIDPYVLTRTVLEKVFFDKAKITDELISNYANILKLPNAKECLVNSAKQFNSSLNKSIHQEFSLIKQKSLIIWGVDDIFIPVVDSYKFRHDIPNAELAVIPQCGHSPHEECPIETAHILNNFFLTL